MIPEITRVEKSLRDCGARGPRLFAELRGNEDAAAIEKKPMLRPFLDQLRSETERLRGGEISVLPFSLYRLFDTSGDRMKYQERYFDHRCRLTVFALAAWLWKKPEDICYLEDCIWAVCDEYSWCLPAHMGGRSLEAARKTRTHGGLITRHWTDNARAIDLSSCETAFSLAECCAMLEDHLTPAVVERARSEAYRRVIQTFLEDGALQHWELLKNNWCAVCAGNIGAAACYLVEDDSLLGGILYRLLPVLERYLESFTEDGACIEGLSYWTYGMSFFTCFADLLFRRTGGAIDLFADPRMEKIALFQQRCYFPGGAIVNFSDAVASGFSPGLTSFLARRFPGVKMPPAECSSLLGPGGRRLGPGLRDLLWTGGGEAPPFTPEELVFFDDAQWLAATSAGASGASFAAKGGHNDEPHNHNDAGSFIFYKKGKMIIADLGAGEYTKDYFSENRYSIFCNRSESHNVPLIAGLGQKPGRRFRAEKVETGPGARMAFDLAPAYGNSALAFFKRELVFENGVLHLSDSFGFSGSPLRVTERFVSLFKPEIRDGMTFIAAGDSHTCIKCSLPLEPAISAAEHRNHAGEAVTVYLIDYTLPQTDDPGVAFVFE